MSAVPVAPSRPHALGVAERAGREANRLRSGLSSRVYLPACAVAAAAVVLIGFGWSIGWGDADFGGSAAALGAVVAGPATLAIIGVFLVVERIWPAQQRPFFARGYRQDLLYTALNATVLVPLVTGLTLSFVAVVRAAAPWIVLSRIDTVPRWVAIAVIVVAMDACNWFVHLANHRVQMLWRFHELHHSQEDMSVLTVFRTHPLLHVSYLFALLPGTVLLANGAMSTTVLVVYTAIVAFEHSNTRLGFGPLERILVSPNYHRIHHQLDGPQDVNLGFALTIWDQLFGRAVFPTEATIRTDTGLPGRPLVVEQSGPRARHLSVLAAQLVAPFRPMRDDRDLPPNRSRRLRHSGRAEESREAGELPGLPGSCAGTDELQEVASW
jgi:sterol desaturase/sphingolipid hydroxylase (fatty acid hydroxylase superfamily)